VLALALLAPLAGAALGTALRDAARLRRSTPPVAPEIQYRASGVRVHYAWTYRGRRFEAEWEMLSEWLEAADREIRELRDSVLEDLRRQGIRRNRRDIALWFWRRAWQKIALRNEARIAEVARTFEQLRNEQGLSDTELKQLLLRFVQSIRYATPDVELGIFAPPQTLVRAFGDCDTKALLYVLILRRLGYDALMFYSPHYQHAMAGIPAQSTGSFLEIRGTRYYFCETTQAGFRIGQLAASVSDLRHWIPLRIL